MLETTKTEVWVKYLETVRQKATLRAFLLANPHITCRGIRVAAGLGGEVIVVSGEYLSGDGLSFLSINIPVKK